MRCAAIRRTWVVLVVASWLVGATASAQSDKTKAKKHFDAGNALVENEDYAAAMAEFELSVRIYPTKTGLFNLANCYKALSRYGDALEVLARLAQEFAGSLGALESEVASLKATVEGMVGRLDVRVDRDGAAILVDGAEVGKSPLGKTLVLAPGDHVVESKLAEFADAAQTVRIVSSEKHQVSFVLKAKPADQAEPVVAPPDPNTQETGQTATPAPDGTQTLPGPPEAKEGKRGVRAAAWVSAAVAVLAGAASGVFYGVASKKAGEFEDARNEYDDAVDQYNVAVASGEPPAQYAEDGQDAWAGMSSASDDTKKSQSLGLGFGIGAGAFAVAAIVLFVAGGRGQESAEAPLGVSAAPGGLAVDF